MSEKGRILCVIPARGGSKSVPKKNIRLLNGIPLIGYTIKVALALDKIFYRIIVSTDDPEIVEICADYGLKVPFSRPASLADDKTPMVPVLQHAVDFVENEDRVKMDWICLLQPTEPLRRHKDVKQALDKAQTTDSDSVISVSRVFAHHPVLMKRIVAGRLVPFSVPEPEGTRRQDYEPPAYMRNGSIYVTRRDVLMETGSIWGRSVTPYVMPEDSYVSIDNERDFRLAELIIQERNESKERK